MPVLPAAFHLRSPVVIRPLRSAPRPIITRRETDGSATASRRPTAVARAASFPRDQKHTDVHRARLRALRFLTRPAPRTVHAVRWRWCELVTPFGLGAIRHLRFEQRQRHQRKEAPDRIGARLSANWVTPAFERPSGNVGQRPKMAAMRWPGRIRPPAHRYTFARCARPVGFDSSASAHS